MIQRVVLRRFKRFQEETFHLPGHIVLAGPNNTGKSTVLQAIAAWGLAFERWKQRNDFATHNNEFAWQPIARQTFSAVPLRSFDSLWNNRLYQGTIEIEIAAATWIVTMEFKADSTEQIYVRPKRGCDPQILRTLNRKTIYVPPMSGLGTDEPVYQPAKIAQLLGQSRPGEVLRNLLLEASQLESAWSALKDSVRNLFGYQLLPPNAEGPDILAEYSHYAGGPRFDIASGGSGFQQVLMLVTFLLTRPASVLLLDEPDAHLHIILQDVIYNELRALSVKQKSQLIIATHSEVIINSVDPRELCVMYGQPRMLADTQERTLLIQGLGTLSNTDILEAQNAPGILYLEGHTDLDILREWARILGHPAHETLTKRLFWKPAVFELRQNGKGIKAREHYDTLRLVRNDLPGLMIVDGDGSARVPDTPITGHGFQYLRWQRYEIESYLVHPESMARYVEKMVGGSSAALHLQDLKRHFEETYPPAFLTDPRANLPLFIGTKARTLLIPPALDAAGLQGIPYTRFHEIAAVMLPEEIHPEVIEKLNAIQRAFNL